jgi:hypothetical protein
MMGAVARTNRAAEPMFVPEEAGLAAGVHPDVTGMEGKDTETRRHGDTETRRHGDTETRRRGDAETRPKENREMPQGPSPIGATCLKNAP